MTVEKALGKKFSENRDEYKKELQRRHASGIDVPFTVVMLNESGRFLYLREAVNGYKPSRIIGTHYSEIYTLPVATEFGKAMAEAKASPRTPVSFETRISMRLGWAVTRCEIVYHDGVYTAVGILISID